MTAEMRPQSQNFRPRAEPTELGCESAVTNLWSRGVCDRGDASAVTKSTPASGAQNFCDGGDVSAVTKSAPACRARVRGFSCFMCLLI